MTRAQCSSIFKNGSFSPPPKQTQGDFSQILTERTWVKIPEVNLTKVWMPPIPAPSLEFFTLRILYNEPPAICQL